MLYGIKSCVDHLLMDMQAQKFKLTFTKEGEKDRELFVQGSLRVLPFGVYEYIFPKESMDGVLTTLNFHNYQKDERYKIPSIAMMALKKALRFKKIPKFDSSKGLLWVKDNVAIIPLGIREDAIVTEVKEPFVGWKHEAL
jgi:hypothetical protein